MTILIGTDEAGYGPNLGPLVVSASCWRFETSNKSLDILSSGSPAKESNLPINSNVSKAKNVKKTKSPQYVQRTFFDNEIDSDSILLGLNDQNKEPTFHSAVLSKIEREKTIDSKTSEKSRLSEILDQFHSICRSKTDYQGIFPIVDSKKLYQSSGSLSPLERTFLRAFVWIHGPIQKLSFAETLAFLDDVSEPPFWEKEKKILLPYDSKTESILLLEESFRPIKSYFDTNRISLLSLKSRRVFPNEYNKKTEKMLKSDFLAETTLTLISKMIHLIINSPFQQEPIIILCDKLGGRNKYEALLTFFFPGSKITTLCESKALSSYQMTIFPNKNILRFEIRFQMKGESNIPTALASICSKYIREISMKLFNDFWQCHIPNLKPTAGYPVDAKRFYQEIREVIDQFNFNHSDIWRNK
ncbi:MAG: hypothetical protein Q4C95_06600 [Planctomycetia bacterium]|nr:hypothetical protein [Planctomycetia bacterium]